MVVCIFDICVGTMKMIGNYGLFTQNLKINL